MCPRRSRPRSAAKQGRSFRVAPINSAPTRFSGGHILMRSRPRAEAASSNLLALHRAVQKPAPTPHGTRARFAAIHQLISSFRVRAGDPAEARITSISGTLATRPRRVGRSRGPPIKTSPLRLRQALAAHGRGHRRSPLRCPI